MTKQLLKLRAQLLKLEDILLVGLLLFTILLAVLQIFLRNFFDSGIVWGDVLLRILVLWIGMFGAMYASRNDEHIKIDLGLRMLPDPVKPYAKSVVYMFTAGICAVVAWYSVGFIFLEYEDNTLAFAKVPVWVCETIIPVAFISITLRYILLTILLWVKRTGSAAS